MARLVVGRQAAGALGLLVALLLRTGHDLQKTFLQILHQNAGTVGASGQQSGLIEQVFQIRAGEAHGSAGDDMQIHGIGQGLALGVDLEDLLAAVAVGLADIDLAVKAARTEQSRIENILTVRGRHDDDAGVAGEAVHFDQELIQGLFAFVVSAAETCASVTSDRVDLVDEDDGGRHLFGLIEQVAHAARADADVELHEVGAGDRQELHVSLACDGLGQKGLAGARRADQQNALRHLCAETVVAGGIAEEFNDLLELGLFLLCAGNVGKGDLLVGLADLRVGAAEFHGGRAAAHPIHQEHHHEDEDRPDDQHRQQARQKGGALRDGQDVILLDGSGLELLGDRIAQILVEQVEIRQLVGDQSLPVEFLAELHGQLAAVNGKGFHLSVVEQLDHVRILEIQTV